MASATWGSTSDVGRRKSLALIKQSTRDHARIARAIAVRDANRAAKEMALHLDHIEETTRRAMKAEMTALAPSPALEY